MYDVIIVGGGVAAFSAAIFTARRGLSVLVLAKDLAGQANFTDLIENYPGILETGGYPLISTIKKQAENFGAKVEIAEVTKVKETAGGFVVSAYGKQYKSTALVLAFGKTPRDLLVSGEEEFKGKGVSYCAVCDAPLYKNKTVAVVGVGDIALEAGLLCAKYAKKVYMLSKTDKLTGHPGLVKALAGKKNVELVPFVRIDEIAGKTVVEELKLKDLKLNKPRHLPINGIFVELGYVVKSEFAANLVKLDDLGQIIVGPNQGTSKQGVLAAGDVTNRPYKQAVVSAGEGAAAGLAVFDWLMRQKGGKGLTSDWTEIKKVK